MEESKYRCPFCANYVNSKNNKLLEHKSKYHDSNKKIQICVGSFLPVYLGKEEYSIGQIFSKINKNDYV